MSIVVATIRVHLDYKSRVIDVDFGADNEGVPSECRNICEIVKPHFERGAIFNIKKQLAEKIPNVVIRVVYGFSTVALCKTVPIYYFPNLCRQ
jgi:hypothetical protein